MDNDDQIAYFSHYFRERGRKGLALENYFGCIDGGGDDAKELFNLSEKILRTDVKTFE